jgi:PTS system N-acetylglucosamine-specific IIC component
METRKAFFQRVSASLIIPITLLPPAAVLLAAGRQLGIGPLEAAGLAIVRTWLPLFFGLGISVGFAGADGMAALSAAAAFLVMTSVATAVAAEPALNVGVLGGIVAGAVSTWLFRRMERVQLPEYLALFSGKRLGPPVSALAGVMLGYLFGFGWPQLHQAIVTAGHWIYNAGGLGAFVYGAALRLLIPTGLHHILMQLVDYQIGGWVDPASGQMVFGEYARFLAGDPSAGRLLSGFFLTLGFGPLGAALAITRAARPEQRRRVAGLMTTGVLTAMFLGVTEPVEFAFIFASPLLFGVHVLLSGVASLLGWLLDIHMGGYALPMMLINWDVQQNAWLLLPLGAAWTAVYYGVFYAVICRLRPPVLGQVPADPENVAPDNPRATAARATAAGATAAQTDAAATHDPAVRYLTALGGAGNLVRVDACMTRLRLEVHDPSALDEGELRRLGAAGVVRLGGGEVQVVVGARAGDIAERLRAYVHDGRST